MTHQGKLVLRDNSTDYGIFGGGKFYNISETLDGYLMDRIQVQIIHNNGKEEKEVFNKFGRLLKQKFNGTWQYCIDGVSFDSILWRLIDRKVKINIVNKERVEVSES